MPKLTLNQWFGADRASKWDWQEQFVQADENFAMGANFAAGKSTLVAAGPASLSGIDSLAGIGPGITGGLEVNVTPVGLTSQVAVSQQLPQQRIAEIGSQRTHFIPGVAVGGGRIQRFIYNGPSLMRALYAKTYDDDGNFTPLGLEGQFVTTDPDAGQQNLAEVFNAVTQDTTSRPGQMHANTGLWMSLADPRFGASFGMGVFFQDHAGRAFGGVYLEGVVIQSHDFAVAAGTNVIAENVAFQFERAIAVHGIGKRQLSNVQ